MEDNQASIPIGIFDSGIGGLSILRAIRQQLPGCEMLYLADQAHVPYGMRPLEEVRAFSVEISRYLIARGAKLVVVACNAASAAALHHLRREFPATPIVGMEPAVKPAAEHTKSGVVGVLATQATFQGALYASVVERFATGVQILQDTCPGLVAQIEAGRLDRPETRLILEKALQPMLEQGIDTVVLGCTHYPFVIPTIQEIVGPSVRVIDPAPAVARQAQRIFSQFWPANDLPSVEEPILDILQQTLFMTTGDPEQMRRLIRQLIHTESEVEQLTWSGVGLQTSAATTPNSFGPG